MPQAFFIAIKCCPARARVGAGPVFRDIVPGVKEKFCVAFDAHIADAKK